MSGLLESLGRSGFRLAPAVPIRPLYVEKARQQIELLFSNVEAKKPAEFDLTQAWEALLAAKRNGNDVRSLDRRTLRHGPWVMFETHDGMSPLAADKGFASAYIKRLMDDAIGAAVINLAQAFLYSYPRRLLTFDLFAQAIPKMLKRCRTARCSRLSVCVERFGLFQSDGPGKVWSHLLQESGSVTENLERAGLSGTLHRNGFGKAVFEHAMTSTGRQLGSGTDASKAVDRLIEFAKEDTSTERRFRYPKYRTALVENLVLPFADGASQADARQLVEAFVVEHYGDPRIDRSRWQGVSEEAVHIVLGWLVADTLEDFFRLIEHTAKRDFTASRHWHYRKAFWSAYLGMGAIDDAWIVLAGQVDADARHVLNFDRKAYGRFKNGTGVQKNHASLILRIGHLVITDWSHSGKYRVWDEGGDPTRSPGFYKPTYTRTELVTNAGFDGSHMGSEHGVWQRRLAGYIRDKTGIQLALQDLMPSSPPKPRASAGRWARDASSRAPQSETYGDPVNRGLSQNPREMGSETRSPSVTASPSASRQRDHHVFSLNEASEACGASYTELRSILAARDAPPGLRLKATKPRWQLDSEDLLGYLWTRNPAMARRLDAFLIRRDA